MAPTDTGGALAWRHGPPDLHRAPGGRDLRRPARGGPSGRVARVRRLLPFRPLPRDHASRAACRDRPMRGSPSPDSPVTPRRSGWGRSSPRPRSAIPGPWPSRWPGSTRCRADGWSSVSGAGWYDDEHHAHGIPYPGLGERFERLEEQLEIVTGMWETPAGRDVQPRRARTTPWSIAGASEADTGPHCRSSSVATAPKRTPRLAATVRGRVQRARSDRAEHGRHAT